MGLLKGLDPLLTADLLHVLRLAGHGDCLCLCDANFPAAALAAKTTTGKLVQLAGADVVQALDAVCSVLPLDFFVESAAGHMVLPPGVELPPLGKEVHEKGNAVILKHCPEMKIRGIERSVFGEEAAQCFAIVHCSGERRPYGNWILKKGVVGPDGSDLKPPGPPVSSPP
eukprot:EG_transcript_22815